MSKRKRLQDIAIAANMERYKLMTVGLSIIMDDIQDDMIIIAGIKRPRTHAYWMAPYLHARTDATQRNTLAKLEADFLRVRIN